jgi:hypothetical protein
MSDSQFSSRCSDVTSAVKNTKTVPVDSAPKDKAVQIAAAKFSQPPKLLHAEAHAAPESKAAKAKAAIARLAVKKISGAAAKASPAETQHHAAATSHAEPAKPTAPVVAAAAHADKSTASKAVKSPAAPAAHASKPAAAAAKAPAHPHNAVAAKPAPPAHRVARGSPGWEREQASTPLRCAAAPWSPACTRARVCAHTYTQTRAHIPALVPISISPNPLILICSAAASNIARDGSGLAYSCET